MFKGLRNRTGVLCWMALVFVLGMPGEGWVQSAWTKEAWKFTDAENGTRSDSLGAIILMDVAPDLNVALGRPARDYKGDEAAVTDGKDSRSRTWRSLEVDAINFFVLIDLEQIRLVDRVRILPMSRDESGFIKGYSLQLSRDNIVFDEVVLNKFNVDTIVDTTFAPTPAGYVKIQVKAIDRVNEVRIGEVEVYAKGYVGSGTFLSEVTNLGDSGAKNFGAARWEAGIPKGTDLCLQFRSGNSRTPDDTWSEWSEELREPGGALFSVLEPRRYLQFRANLSSENPEITPGLRSIEIEFGPPLARTASASVRREIEVSDTLAPNEAATGEPADFVCTIRTVLDAQSLGFDEVVLFSPSRMFVRTMSLDAVELFRDAYAVYDTMLAVGQRTTFFLSEPVKKTSIVSLGLEGKLFDEVNPFSVQLRNAVAAPENPQAVEAESEDALLLFTRGALEDVLDPSNVTVAPNPFSPDGDGRFDVVEIRYDLAKLDLPRRVALRVFDLSGALLWEVERQSKSGVYVEQWDGRDRNGKFVPPGLYVYQIEVHLRQGPEVVTGGLVVAY